VSIDGFEVAYRVRLLRPPGHSIDRASVELTSAGEAALFSGEVFHHAVKIQKPDLVSVSCGFPDASRRSRRWFLEHASVTGATASCGHFLGASVGRIVGAGGGFGWAPVSSR
jgi:hypothetical protein